MVKSRLLPRFTDRLSLGRAGLKVSPFCLGLVCDEDSVMEAFEAGVNFFFITADMHWTWYESLRRGLKQLVTSRPARRDDIVIAAVAYPTQPEFNIVPFQEILVAVPELERIDVLVAGGAYAGELANRLPVYRRHRRSRHCGARAIGASFHDRKAARDVVDTGEVDIAYIRYNPRHPGARSDLFEGLGRHPRTLLYSFKCRDGFVEPTRWKELGCDDVMWQPELGDFYRFALTRRELDGVLFSIGGRGQVAKMADALARGPLAEEEEEYLIKLAAVGAGRARIVPSHRV